MIQIDIKNFFFFKSHGAIYSICMYGRHMPNKQKNSTYDFARRTYNIFGRFTADMLLVTRRF